ncbi:Uncharacterised protein [Klebsiella pneumoniae]|uniref:Uncharacterized protein n=1 Tax=Klebsiella pneumoniae TaxID=573 RepID=A0A378H4D1_KLEPN|nr:Uncharacterised protein [Klebsiella pneumoniae]
MERRNENEGTRLVWSVVTGEKTGGEEPHFDYPTALQALILEAPELLAGDAEKPSIGAASNWSFFVKKYQMRNF